MHESLALLKDYNGSIFARYGLLFVFLRYIAG